MVLWCYGGMKRILVLVEGPSDKGFVEEILRRLGLKPRVLVMRGNRPEKAVRYLKAQKGDYDKAVILKDLHKRREEAVEKLVKKIYSRLKESREDTSRVKCIIVRRALESWFLADPEALEKTLGCRVNVGGSEELSDLSQYLNQELEKHGKQYIKSMEVSRRVARKINIETARRRSRSFNEFIEAVMNS